MYSLAAACLQYPTYARGLSVFKILLRMAESRHNWHERTVLLLSAKVLSLRSCLVLFGGDRHEQLLPELLADR